MKKEVNVGLVSTVIVWFNLLWVVENMGVVLDSDQFSHNPSSNPFHPTNFKIWCHISFLLKKRKKTGLLWIVILQFNMAQLLLML